MLAAFFEGVGNVLRDFIDAPRNRVADERNVLTQIDLHAGQCLADLFGLPCEVFALSGDIVQQSANANFVVAVGALERGDFVADQRFEFAGARDRALDAVTHRGDFAADGLADADHGIAGQFFRLGETQRHLRHRLCDQTQLLAAPGKHRHEIKQDQRRQKQRAQADQCQRAAAFLTGDGFECRHEQKGQKTAGDNPEAREQRCNRIGAAARTALLNGLQHLADRLAIVVGGRAAEARLLRVVVGAKIERKIGGVPAQRTPASAFCLGRAEVESVLDGGQCVFGWILDLRIFCHVSCTPLPVRISTSAAKNGLLAVECSPNNLEHCDRESLRSPSGVSPTSANILLA